MAFGVPSNESVVLRRTADEHVAPDFRRASVAPEGHDGRARPFPLALYRSQLRVAFRAKRAQGLAVSRGPVVLTMFKGLHGFVTRRRSWGSKDFIFCSAFPAAKPPQSG
jgi:hypothetical protein